VGAKSQHFFATQAQSEPRKYNNLRCGGTVPEATTPTAWTKHKSQLHRRYHLPSTFLPTILIYTSLLLRYKANPASTTAYTAAVPTTWYCTKRTPQVQQLNSTVVPSTWYCASREDSRLHSLHTCSRLQLYNRTKRTPPVKEPDTRFDIVSNARGLPFFVLFFSFFGACVQSFSTFWC